MTNEEIESCIQTLRFLENNFINDHGIFINDKHPDNIEKIIKFLKGKRWIPVRERLPEDYIHVLCQFTLGGMGECYLAHGVFHVVGGLVMTCNEVIAWQPLPQRYEVESKIEQAVSYADQDTLMSAT